jgi:hypothetical protein
MLTQQHVLLYIVRSDLLPQADICPPPLMPQSQWSIAGAAAAEHYGTDMAAKKPLIKTTAIQYCLDNAGDADEAADVRSIGFLSHSCSPGAGLPVIRQPVRICTDHPVTSLPAAADADEEAPVADAAEAVAEAAK